MEYISAIISMALIWFLVVTIPGPNFLVVTQVSMARSRKMGFLIALGVSTGAGTWATASLLGLSALFRYVPWMYGTTKVIGGLYLIYMGASTIRHALKSPDSSAYNETDKDCNGAAAFRKGLYTSFSNPKTAAFFGSLFLSTFPARAPLWFNSSVVLTVILISVIWYWLVACIFSFNKIKALYKSAKRVLDIVTGSLLSCLGLRLIFART